MAQPEIPGTDVGKVIMPYGSTGSKWVALLVSALGKLQVEIDASVLPTDAATQTTLAALLTELKLKADLTETQPVEAKDGDKIFSLESVVAESNTGTISGDNGYLASDPVPAGRVWKITNVYTSDDTTASTKMILSLYHDGTDYAFYILTKAIGISEGLSWSGEVWLDASDVIRVHYVGGEAGDNIHVALTGYQMNAP